MAHPFAKLRNRTPPAVGASGDGAVALAGAFPAWRVVDPPADARRVAGLPPGRVRLKRLTLPPADADTAAKVAAVQAEGLLPEGVDGDTAAGEPAEDHRVWVAALAAGARGGLAGPAADAATGLGALLASDLGLAASGAARLEAGVLLVAATADAAALVCVDAGGPTESVVVDLGDEPGAALTAGVERIEGAFTSRVEVGDALPQAGAGAVLATRIPAEEAFGPLLAAGVALDGDGWLAAGAAAAAAFGPLPVPGAPAAGDGESGPGAPGWPWFAAAAAAVLAGAAALAWSDLSAAARLDDALEARPALAEAEATLSSDAALQRWLEAGGPTPLAVLDEVTALLGGTVPESLRVSSDTVELEGTVDDPSQIDALVERLAGAQTFTAVRLQRTQRVSDREFRYAIEAEPVDRFYEAFARPPAEDDDAEEPADGGEPA